MNKKEFEEFNLENLILNEINYFKQHENNHDITNSNQYNDYKKKLVKISVDDKYFNSYNFSNNTDFSISELHINDCELRKFENISGDGNIENYYFYNTGFGLKGNPKYLGEPSFVFGNLNKGNTNTVDILFTNNNYKIGNIIFAGFSINKIKISSKGKNIIVKSLKFNSNKTLNTLLIDNIEISELIIENINNNFESFEIRNCKIDKLIIRNSNLGKAVFNGVEIGKLEIENTTLNDCIFNGVDFKTYELEEIKYGDSVNYKGMKDNYRQLKHVMDKNMNYTEANEFYALEMKYYMKSVGLTNNISFLGLYTNNFQGRDSKKIGEKIILTLGFLINDFGNNLVRNLVVIYMYLFLIITLTYALNYSGSIINNIFSIGLAWGQIISLVLICLVIIINDKSKIVTNGLKLFDKVNNYDYGKLSIVIFTIIYIITLSFYNVGNFKGIHSIIYLINPFSGLTPNSMSHLLWSEQLGMIIHKIIYGILIYQLIIALKRTTKR